MVDFNNEAGLRVWNETQLRTSLNWVDLRKAEGLDDNRLIMEWIRLFAEDAIRICQQYGVQTKTFENVMSAFENRIVPDIERQKYYRSQQENHDVGLRATLKALPLTTELIHDSAGPVGVMMTLYFPPIGEGNLGHAEKVYFPIERNPELQDIQEESRRDFGRALSA